ncbi:helix-turn-helix domain-containing protein [Rhodococcus sp. NPDC127528]|uniref:helix-turn-helix domain-containing protein n=1 Tax=unclassified Rhodococcus (in: high G+C Gram-positive bacteria) TaxID=192944 RepID=UPI003630C016
MSGFITQTQLAEAMDISWTSVSRTLMGHAEPGAKFIAGLLAAFPHLTFDDLFEVVTEEKAPADVATR